MPNHHPSTTDLEAPVANVLPWRPAPQEDREDKVPAQPVQVLSIQGGFDTIKEFCAFFRISRTTFHKLVNEGRVRPVKIGRKTLIPRSEHENMLYRLPQPALFPQEELAG